MSTSSTQSRCASHFSSEKSNFLTNIFILINEVCIWILESVFLNREIITISRVISQASIGLLFALSQNEIAILPPSNITDFWLFKYSSMHSFTWQYLRKESGRVIGKVSHTFFFSYSEKGLFWVYDEENSSPSVWMITLA